MSSILYTTLGMIALASFMLYNKSNESESSIKTDYSPPNDTVVYDTFHHWKQQHNKVYGAAEDQQKFEIFKNNYHFIHESNAKNSNLELGLNEYADITHEQFKETRLGMTQPDQRQNVQYLDDTGAPESFDWREKGMVSPVKNQGQCGSCWAFSAIGAIEGLYAIKKGKMQTFSEQQLVDCSTEYGNNGCNGGLMDNAFKYIEKFGIMSEDDYPYKAVSGECHYSEEKEIFKVDQFVDVPRNSPSQLVLALQKGPVSVGIDAGERSFMFYKGGVYDQPCGDNLNHGVLIVGYGKDYYIVKNSWGNGWGEDGYIKMKRDNKEGEGICGIRMAASYPILKMEMLK